ncbi:MAG TPA: alpha/beta hydrolase [Dehalococcoidia bacterium]|nr:alpha/beta hydrolase [Dehalococcoidia bacterium]
MPKAPINGIELYYESHGDDSAPAIVFAHGRGGNHMSWWQQVAAFSGEFRCITFDHRGWGASIAEHGTPLRENFIDDLAALLDYLKIDKTFLVAQSMGGFSCLGFALAHPERTLGLVLGDTTGGVATEGTLAALKNTNPAPEGPARSLSASFIQDNQALTFLYQQVQGLNPPRGEDGVISGFRREDGPQIEDFAGWQIPTLLIVGKEDSIFPPEVIAEVQKVIPGSRMEIVPGAAHSAHFEQAAVFNGYLSELFASVRSGTVAGAAAD